MPNIGFWATAGAGAGGAYYLASISTSSNSPFSLYSDTSANPYITGIDYSSGYGKAFLIALNKNGTSNWARSLTDSYSSHTAAGNSVIVDNSGNSYVAGYAKNSSGGTDTFIAKYDSAGTIQWQKTIYNGSQSASVRTDTIWSIAFNSNQTNIYFAGRGADSGITAYGVAFVGSLSISTQTLNWSRKYYSLGSNGDTTALTVTSDSSNNVYVGGQTGYSVYIDSYVMKIDSSGTLQWHKTINSSNNNTQTLSIVVDSSGNVYSGGWAYVSGNLKGWIAKFNSAGTLQWQKMTNVQMYVSKLYADASGNIYVVGSAADTSKAMYYLKIDSSGSILYQGSITATTNYFYGASSVGTNNFILDSETDFALLANNGLGTRMYVTKFPSGSAYVKSVSAYSDTITYAAGSVSLSTSSFTSTTPSTTLTSGINITAGSLTDAAYTATYEKVSI